MGVVGSDIVVLCLRIHQSKQSQMPFLMLSTSGFTSESTTKIGFAGFTNPDSGSSTEWTDSLNLFHIWIRIQQTEYGLYTNTVSS